MKTRFEGKLEKFIRDNFNLSEEDLKHVPLIVNEITAEYPDGIGEYELYDVFDEKLAEKLS